MFIGPFETIAKRDEFRKEIEQKLSACHTTHVVKFSTPVDPTYQHNSIRPDILREFLLKQLIAA
jgi:hypothetical protein